MPTKKSKPSASVIQLADIAGFTVAQAASGFADRHVASTRIFVEMGKFANHIENQKLKPGQTLYGILKAKGVPEGTVNNARQASKFIQKFVHTGLVSEKRFDEIITFRIANQAVRLTDSEKNKCAITETPERLAELLNTGKKAAIGDELDSLAEHGLNIADRAAAEEERIAEEKRQADLNAAAANLPAETPAETPAAETPAETPTGETPAETPTGETPAKVPASTAKILAGIDELSIKSYDLDDEGQAAVCEKLADWIALLQLEPAATTEAAAA
jgi:hypothetical protein